MELTLGVAIGSHLLMVVAFFLHRMRIFHMIVMRGVVVLDLLFPFYLVMNNDWYRRLIEQQEILSFLIWMHFILALTLYGLYFLQIVSAKKMLRGDMEVRSEHRSQGVGILIARGLLVLSAALLIEPG